MWDLCGVCQPVWKTGGMGWVLTEVCAGVNAFIQRNSSQLRRKEVKRTHRKNLATSMQRNYGFSLFNIITAAISKALYETSQVSQEEIKFLCWTQNTQNRALEGCKVQSQPLKKNLITLGIMLIISTWLLPGFWNPFSGCWPIREDFCL